MSEVSTAKYFLFLNRKQNWFEEADTNSDDVVIKAEFRQFLDKNSAEFEAFVGVLPGEDIINKFWNQLDTSKENKRLEGHKLKDLNAIGKNTVEFDRINANITGLNELEKFMRNTVNKALPNYLTATAQQGWLNLIREDLSEVITEVVDNTDDKNLNNINFQSALLVKFETVKDSHTAEQCDDDFFNSIKNNILALYSEYDFTEDETLQNIILATFFDNIENIIGTETDYKKVNDLILTEGRKILDAYIATATLSRNGNVSFTYDGTYANKLKEYGYETNKNTPINDLQKAVLIRNLRNDIATEFANDKSFIEYQDKFNNAVNEYIVNNINSNNITFEDFFNNKFNVETFKASNEFKRLEHEIKIQEICNSEGFKSILANSIGAKTEDTDKITEALQVMFDLPEYKEAIQEIINNINKYIGEGENEKGAGFITNNNIDDQKVSNQIIKHVKDAIIDATVTLNISSRMAIGDIQNAYKEACTAVSYMDSIDRAYEKNLAFAQKICDTIFAKGHLSYVSIITGKLGADYSAGLAKLSTSEEIQTVMNAIFAELAAVEESIKNEYEDEGKKAAIYSAAKNIVEKMNDIANNNIVTIIGNNSEFNPNFGINENGDIFFENNKTKEMYDRYINALKSGIDADVIELLGGENTLSKLAQAAWIMTYDTYNCSIEDCDIDGFINKLFENAKSLFESLTKNPSLINVYTGPTAFYNSALTTNLVHYNKNTTYRDDETINYTTSTLSETTIVLKSEEDNSDYQTTMKYLKERLINAYPNLEESLITKIFNKAKYKAICTMLNNTQDCPYGTSRGGEISNWGYNNRKGDDFETHMDELVQLTLYCFDKLLYKELATNTKTEYTPSSVTPSSKTNSTTNTNTTSDNTVPTMKSFFEKVSATSVNDILNFCNIDGDEYIDGYNYTGTVWGGKNTPYIDGYINSWFMSIRSSAPDELQTDINTAYNKAINEAENQYWLVQEVGQGEYQTNRHQWTEIIKGFLTIFIKELKEFI